MNGEQCSVGGSGVVSRGRGVAGSAVQCRGWWGSIAVGGGEVLRGRGVVAVHERASLHLQPARSSNTMC